MKVNDIIKYKIGKCIYEGKILEIYNNSLWIQTFGEYPTQRLINKKQIIKEKNICV